MTDEIIKIRERLVELSKDPIETRELLDKLTYEEIAQHDADCPLIVTKNDIQETKDGEIYKLHKTRNGYLLHYHGGYDVLVDDKLLSTASALQQIMDGVPSDITDKEEREGIELTLSAAEMVFRLPMFVLSHPITTLNIATMGIMYISLLQKLGEVPTAETDNPEYDKALFQMNEFMENFAKGLEKEGKEYERRMGYGEETDTQENESQDKGQGGIEKTE